MLNDLGSHKDKEDKHLQEAPGFPWTPHTTSVREMSLPSCDR